MENESTITASELIINRLEQHGIDQAFGVVGGAIMYITDALRASNKIRSTFTHHEQSAAIAAEAFAKVANRPAIVFATAGPGVTNLITGVADAYMDSVPMVLVVGDVRSTIAANFRKQRYNAPQEVDQRALITPIVKRYQYLTPDMDGSSIIAQVDAAHSDATSGRQGPVCLSIPLDVQGLRFSRALLDAPIPITQPVAEKSTEAALSALQALMASRRPLVLLGAGVRLSGAVERVRDLLDRYSLPYCVTIGAIDLLDKANSRSCGCVGPTSQRAANVIFQASDCVLAIGTSFDQSVTGFNIADLLVNKKVYLVNIDEGEFLRFEHDAIKPILTDIVDFCDVVDRNVIDIASPIEWLDSIAKLRLVLTAQNEAAMRCSVRSDYLSAYDITARISECLPRNSMVVLGISLDAHSVFNAFQVDDGQRILVSRNLGPMGWDVPALLGAAYATKGNGPLVLITGDGSLMVNVQELAVIAAKRIPACIFVFNNDGYVSIRTTQANFFGNDFFGCDATSGLCIPALASLAHGFGLEYSEIHEISDIQTVLSMHQQMARPRIVECRIDPQQLREPRLVTRMEHGKFRTPVVCDMTPVLNADLCEAVNAIFTSTFVASQQ